MPKLVKASKELALSKRHTASRLKYESLNFKESEIVESYVGFSLNVFTAEMELVRYDVNAAKRTIRKQVIAEDSVPAAVLRKAYSLMHKWPSQVKLP